jgi:hypothetical protein
MSVSLVLRSIVAFRGIRFSSILSVLTALC